MEKAIPPKGKSKESQSCERHLEKVCNNKKRKRNPNKTLKIVIKPEEKRRRKGKKTLKKSKTINKMAIRKYIWIISLNVNGLNDPTKRHRLTEWIQKQDLYICCLQETHFRSRGTHTD